MVRFVTGYPKDKRDISTALRKNNTSSYTNFIRYGRHITRKPKSTFEILIELVIIQFWDTIPFMAMEQIAFFEHDPILF